MTAYNWQQVKKKRGSGGFRDDSLINIKSRKSRKYCVVTFHRKILQKLNNNAKYVQVFFSPESSFIGFKFLTKKEKDSYVLRKTSKSAIRYEVRSAFFSYFEPKKYFKKDLKIEDGMAIIKVNLVDKKMNPAVEQKFGFRFNNETKNTKKNKRN